MDWYALLLHLALAYSLGLVLYLVAMLSPIEARHKAHLHAIVLRWISMMGPFLILLALSGLEIGRIWAFIFIFLTMQRACQEYARRLLMPHDFSKFLTVTAILVLATATFTPQFFALMPHLVLLIAIAFAIWRIRFENSWVEIGQSLLACIWLIIPIATFAIIALSPNGTHRLIVLGLCVATANFLSEFVRILAHEVLQVPLESTLGHLRSRWRIRLGELFGAIGSCVGACLLLQSLLMILPQIDQGEALLLGLVIGLTSFLGTASLRLFIHVTEQTDPLFLQARKMLILDKIAPFTFTNGAVYLLYTMFS